MVGCVTMKTKPRQVGQKFRSRDNNTYILAQTAPYKVSLINLETGNRLCEAVKVKNVFAITPNQWTKIVGFYGARYFTKI